MAGGEAEALGASHEKRTRLLNMLHAAAVVAPMQELAPPHPDATSWRWNVVLCALTYSLGGGNSIAMVMLGGASE